MSAIKLTEAIKQRILPLDLDIIKNELIGFSEVKTVDYYESTDVIPFYFRKPLILTLLFAVFSAYTGILINDMFIGVGDLLFARRVSEMVNFISDAIIWFSGLVFIVLCFLYGFFRINAIFNGNKPVYKTIKNINQEKLNKLESLLFDPERKLIIDKDTDISIEASYQGIEKLLNQDCLLPVIISKDVPLLFAEYIQNDIFDRYVDSLASIQKMIECFGTGVISEKMEKIIFKALALIQNARTDESNQSIIIRFLDKYLGLIITALEKYPVGYPNEEVTKATNDTIESLFKAFSLMEKLIFENNKDDYLSELNVINNLLKIDGLK